jgi:hypothetical protein
MVADWLKDIAPVSSNNWALVFVLHVATTMFRLSCYWNWPQDFCYGSCLHFTPFGY